MKWLNGVTGTWTDLGDPKLGGVHLDEKSIWYILERIAGAPCVDPRHLHQHFRRPFHLARRTFERR